MNDFHFHSDFHQVIVRSRRVRSWAVFPLGTILPASGVWGQLLIASIVQSPMLPNPKPYSDCGTWPICILSCTKTTDTLQRWGYARCDGTCPFSLHGSLSFQKSLLHTASLTSPAAFSRCFSGLAMVGIHCGLSASLSDTPDCSESQDTNECEIGTLAPHGILRWFSNRSSSRVQVKQHLPSGLEHTAFSSVSWLPEGWSWTQGICISGELVGNAESQAPA